MKKGQEKITRSRVENVNIKEIVPLPSPLALKKDIPLSSHVEAMVFNTRKRIAAILTQRSRRLLVIAGPCSIHDPQQALEYAARIAQMRAEFGDWFEIIMRVYLEKPRTTIGWKGLVHDPFLDGSNRMDIGLREGRRLFRDINELGVPCGTEYVGPDTPQYSSDLVSWACIGARTTESQTHREATSGFSMPVGFKNSTEGNIQLAVDAVITARSPHCFSGMDEYGQKGMVISTGNPWGHIILRGGKVPNYHPPNIEGARQLLIKAGLDPVLLVDCSHGNCERQHEKQCEVWASTIDQRVAGNDAIGGLMLESNKYEGKQPFPKPGQIKQLRRGVSITDACISADTTEDLFRQGQRKMAASGLTVVDMMTPQAKRRPQGQPGARPVVPPQPKPTTPPAP